MASIRKTRSGNWKVQIRVNGFNPVSKTFKTKADAEIFSKHTESQMGLGRYVERNELDSKTLGDFPLL